MEHLLWLNWSFALLIHTKQAISNATHMEYWNSDFRSWIYIKKLVLLMYNMSYASVVSSDPFLVIIIVFTPARAADQIWWCLLQIPHLYIIIYQLFKSFTDGDVIYNPMLADYSKTLLIECHQKMDLNDVNIEQCDETASKSHKEHCGWNQMENWCLDHTHAIHCGTGLHFTIAVGSTLKNSAECIYICTNSPNYQIWLVWSSNWHHSQIHVMVPNTYTFVPILQITKFG